MINLDELFDVRTTNVKDVVSNEMPVYENNMSVYNNDLLFSDYDMRVFFYMPYNSKELKYGYMKEFELYQPFFELFSEDFVFGFFGEIEEFEEKTNPGLDFYTNKRRKFGMFFKFGKNKIRIFMLLLLMFRCHRVYHNNSKYHGFKSLNIFMYNSLLDEKKFRECVIFLDFISNDDISSYWKIIDNIKMLFNIINNEEILLLHRELQNIKKRKRINPFLTRALSTYVSNNKIQWTIYSLSQKLIGSDLLSITPKITNMVPGSFAIY